MEILRFTIFGIASGGLIALLSQGLVLVYRGSGLLNFAQGAIALAGGFAYYEVAVRAELPKYLGLVVAVAFCSLLSFSIHYGIMRPMRHASALQRVIATLGVLIVIQSFAYVRYGFDPLRVPSLFPTRSVTFFSDELVLSLDRLIIIVLCLVVSAALYFGYRNSSFGRVTTAVAENQLAASSFGHSPDKVAAINWALSGALAGLVGVLISPLIFLEPTALVLLIIPAMSAALIGRFVSFPVTFAAAIALGIAQSLIQRYVGQPGWTTAAPFLVVVAVLVISGRALPLRSFVLDRPPAVGSGRVRPLVVIPLVVLVGWVVFTMSADWATAAIHTLALAIVCLSVVVITGFTGQLSLAQASLAGVGALIAARLTIHGVPFILAVPGAAIVTALVGLVISIPALRIRGITLAVVTLGLGGVITDLLLRNQDLAGGLEGLSVPVPSLFGLDIDPFFYPARYATVVFGVLVLVALAVVNLRRGRTGRRLLAVRSNERAAASLGVNVPAVKSYAFALSAAIASVGGTLLAFGQTSVNMVGFTLFLSISIVGVVVVGGVGNVPGALLGSLMLSGGIVGMLFESWPSVNTYLPLIGGVILLATLIVAPDGLFELNRQSLTHVPWRKLLHLSPAKPPKRQAPPDPDPVRVPARALTVENLSISFGGVQAVRNVSLDIRPGEIHGLIGPNGAGKTTLIDGITGLVRSTSDSVRIGDVEVSRMSARRRNREGIARSFQSLELFVGLTIRENLAVACERPSILRYLGDLVLPGDIRLSPAAWEAVRRFQLIDLIDEHPESTSFGHRKAVAIARSVAGTPSVLLLDEPAAGLGDVEAQELAELITVLAREWGIGVLLVEHNVDLVLRLCDRVTVLQSGAVIMSGTPEEVRRDPAVIDAYLGAPA
ncbi:ATP-binding cassette domain-containing protein [Gordonia sp. NPDC058843]|uniref:ABC transporter permease subunit n=1 Tax=Gordonia sp. NPDC058843 TaxID=3346648 RepID=UPI0036C334F3